MTTMKEVLLGMFKGNPAWCRGSQYLIQDTAEAMYINNRRPDIWMQTLAHMDLPTARAAVADIAQHVAAELDEGELKTKLASVTDSMTDEQYAALVSWAEPRRNGGAGFMPPEPSNPTECKLLYTAARFLLTNAKDYAGGPVRHLIQREINKGEERDKAHETVGDYLRTLATLEQWSGSYE